MKKMLAIVLCITTFFAVSTTAYALGPEVGQFFPRASNAVLSLNGYVSGTNINFRKEPNLSCGSWGYFTDGESITILELYYAFEDGYWWTKVQARGYTGYVASMYVHYY